MKTGIIGVLNNPATSLNSHSAGMVNIVANLFRAEVLTEEDDWDLYDKLIIYHGVNFRPGSYNVIGGINQGVIDRANKLNNFKNKVYTLDGFQLNDFSVKRKLSLYDLSDSFEKIQLPTRSKLLIGDSHSISVWQNESYSINRIDGKTLFGFLKNPVLADHYYFGNIDIRFHLPRQVNPMHATEVLVKRYINHARLNNATVTCLLPVENEDRKIPSTGLYKKKHSFFGSRELRQDLVDLFNGELLVSGLPVQQWPKEWYENIDFYQTEVMEPKQSVHIRPKYYAKENQKGLF
jgi:hypothetical protein